MHNRSTYGDPRKAPNRPQTTSRQRQTMMNAESSNTHTMSHIRHPNTKEPHHHQVIAKNILEVLQLISTDSKQRASLSNNSLRPNQKTLINTVSSLLSSLDNSFESSMLEIDMLTGILTSLGYLGNISKNIFNPVGAPHTWGQCLQLMEWLAELAHANHELRNNQRELQQKQSFNSILIKAFNEDDHTIVENFIHAQVRQIQKDLEESEFDRESHELATKNLNNQQKDLVYMEAEEKKLEGILFREKEKVIELDQQNDRHRSTIQQLEQQIEQKTNQDKLAEITLEKLRKEVKNQQLSVEEVEQLQIQIRELKNGILQIKRRKEERDRQFTERKSEIIEGYVRVQKVISDYNREIERLKNRIPHQGLTLQLPVPDRNLLINYMNNKSEFADPEVQERIWKMKERACSSDNLFVVIHFMKKTNQEARLNLQKLVDNNTQLNKKKQTLSKKIKTRSDQNNNLKEEIDKEEYKISHSQHQKEAVQKNIQLNQSKLIAKRNHIEEIKQQIVRIQIEIKEGNQYRKRYEKNIAIRIDQKKQSIAKFQKLIDATIKEQNESFQTVNDQLTQVHVQYQQRAQERRGKKEQQKRQ